MLSSLRRSDNLSLLFVFGLAISIASFVDSLTMGRDALDFLLKQLALVRGLDDIIAFIGAVIHGTLEWWRSVVSKLVELIGFRIPNWMHQPVSVTFFIMSRAVNQGVRAFGNTERDYTLIGRSGKQRRPFSRAADRDDDDSFDIPPLLVAALNQVRAWRAASSGLAQSFGILFVMLICIFVDKAYVGIISAEDLEVLSYLFVMAGLMLVFYFVSDRAFWAFLRLRDAATDLDQNQITEIITRERERSR